MKHRVKSNWALLLATLLLLSTASSGATWYWSSKYSGSTAPSAPTQTDWLLCGSCQWYWYCAYEREEAYLWIYTQTDTDPIEQGHLLTAHDRRCEGGCTPWSDEVDVTAGQSTTVEWSASTSWNAGITWTVMKDVLALGAGYSETNSTSYSNCYFTSTTWHITCATPKCKHMKHYLKWAVDQSDLAGPVSRVHWMDNGYGEYVVQNIHGVGTGSATWKVRAPYTDNTIKDTLDSCPTDTPSHCGHDGCVCH